MRHKETHFMNMPSYANRVVEFAMTVLTDKLKNRVAVSQLDCQFLSAQV